MFAIALKHQTLTWPSLQTLSTRSIDAIRQNAESLILSLGCVDSLPDKGFRRYSQPLIEKDPHFIDSKIEMRRFASWKPLVV